MRSKIWVRAVILGGFLVLASSSARAAEGTPPDAWLTTKTKIAVLSSVGTAGSKINVDTVGGRVTLHGQVASDSDKAKAEKAAQGIAGVKEVRNLLQIVPPGKAEVISASDSEIERNVAKALQRDKYLEGSDVSVESVNNGMVLLAGKADSLADHLRAIEVARDVPGVKAVRSEIKSPDAQADTEIFRDAGKKTKSTAKAAGSGISNAASDAWITSATKARLLADHETPSLDINVDTDGGVVTLSGKVPSREAKEAAEADARKVKGVKEVRNELEIVAEGQKEDVQDRDTQLEERAKQAIHNHKDLRNADISVEVNNGVARLTGTVDTNEQGVAAVKATKQVNGIRSVKNDLRVRSEPMARGKLGENE